MTPDDERRVMAMLQGSTLWRLGAVVADASAAAAAHSSFLRLVRGGRTDVAERVRLGGVAVAIAAGTHLLFVNTWPRATVGTTPAATAIVCGLIGLILAAWPHASVTAWPRSGARRLLHHLSPRQRG